MPSEPARADIINPPDESQAQFHECQGKVKIEETRAWTVYEFLEALAKIEDGFEWAEPSEDCSGWGSRANE